MLVARRLTGSVRSRKNTTDATNIAKTALHNHRVTKPKMPNASSSRRTVNNVTRRAEMVRLIAVYLRGSRKLSSSAMGAIRNPIDSGAVPAPNLAPRCFIVGKATKNPLMIVRDKWYPNK